MHTNYSLCSCGKVSVNRLKMPLTIWKVLEGGTFPLACPWFLLTELARCARFGEDTIGRVSKPVTFSCDAYLGYLERGLNTGLPRLVVRDQLPIARQFKLPPPRSPVRAGFVTKTEQGTVPTVHLQNIPRHAIDSCRERRSIAVDTNS